MYRLEIDSIAEESLQDRQDGYTSQTLNLRCHSHMLYEWTVSSKHVRFYGRPM